MSLLQWLVQAELTCGVLTVVLQASSLLSVCLPNCSLTAAPRHRLFLPPSLFSPPPSLKSLLLTLVYFPNSPSC